MNIDWIELGDVIVRAILSLITLFLITKLLGKKQVSQLSLFDYVIGISIGNFAAEMTINTDSNCLNGILAVVIFGLMAYLISIATMKSIVLRRYFMGVPTILIQNGKLLRKNLRKVKFDMNDLLQECRGMGYFDISDIEYAIMEANGKISILPTGKCKPLLVEDMDLKERKQGLCANIIIDGKIMKNNLKIMNKTTEWLEQQLKEKGKQKKDILLATLDVNEKLVIYLNNYDLEPKNVLE